MKIAIQERIESDAEVINRNTDSTIIGKNSLTI